MDEPHIFPVEEFYLDAFYDLTTCRQISSEGSGPIPWTAIKEYGEYHQLDDFLLDAFITIIKEMDAGYLNWQAAEIKRQAEINKGKK